MPTGLQLGRIKIQGVKGSGVTIPSATMSTYLYTGSRITLPPGKYMVTVQSLMTVGSTNFSNAHIWLRTTFSDSPTTFSPSNDISTANSGNLISGLLPQGARFNMLSGSVIIHNQGTSPKTYYYIAGRISRSKTTSDSIYMFGSHSEWSMIAVPVQ